MEKIVANQQEFNTLVLETMEDFDMPIEEAMPFAVSQLEALNLNCNLLITDVEVVRGEDPVSTFLKTFETSTEKDHLEPHQLENQLKEVEKFLEQDLKYRCYAGKLKLQVVLSNFTKWHADAEPGTIEMTLRCLKTLCSGYPDVITAEFIDDLYRIYFQYKDHKTLPMLIVHILLEAVKLHEMNKEALFKNPSMVPLLKSLIFEDKKTDESVVYGCEIIHNLGKDDDIREISKAHTRATSLAEEFLLPLYQELRLSNGPEKNLALLKAVTSMIVTNTLAETLHLEDPTFEVPMILLRDNLSNQQILANTGKLLVAISGNDDCRSTLGSLIPLICRTIDVHIGSQEILRALYLVASSLTLRNKTNALAFIELNAIDKILQGMKTHDNQKLRQYGLMALRNMASASKTLEAFHEAGTAEFVNSLLTNSKLTQECKSLLIAIGSSVALNERWTGQQGDIVGKNEKLQSGC